MHRILHSLFAGVMLFLLTGTLWAADPAPIFLVLYKDGSGTFTTRTDEHGDLLLDINTNNPNRDLSITVDTTALDPDHTGKDVSHIHVSGAGYQQDPHHPDNQQLKLRLGADLPNLDLLGHWYAKTNTPASIRTHRSAMARVLIPFASAALAFGSISNDNLNFLGTDFRTNFGHYMVLATVANLGKYVDESTAELLKEHHLGGVIPPEWAAKGAVAVLMLGMGKVQSVGNKTQLGTGKSIRFFAQSGLIGASNFMLGEVSAQVVDRIVGLSPNTYKLISAAAGAASTGGLYYLLTSTLGGRNITRDMHTKISNATVLGISKATVPMIEDFTSLNSNDPLVKHLSSHALMELVSLSMVGGLYALVNYQPYFSADTNRKYLAQLLAGSFAKLAGINLAELLGTKTIKLLHNNQPGWSQSITKLASYLTVSILANNAYTITKLVYPNSIPENVAFKIRDGIYIGMLANGFTDLIDDLIYAIEPERPLTLNLTLDSDQRKAVTIDQ